MTLSPRNPLQPADGLAKLYMYLVLLLFGLCLPLHSQNLAPHQSNLLPDSLNKHSSYRDTLQNNPTQTDTSLNTQAPDTMEPHDVSTAPMTFTAVGDIMLGTHYPNRSFLPPDDGKYLLFPIKEILTRGDVNFGNLEGVFLNDSGNVKKCSNPNTCYAFKMPDHYASYLSEAGFHLLSLANNHIRDFGTAGTLNTQKILGQLGIAFAGLTECPYTVIEKNGIKIGFTAFAPNTGTLDINDLALARALVTHLDSLADIVVVSFHGGAEGTAHKHITKKTEVFLGEERGNPYAFAREVINAGADLVWGHGPHVPRALELYQGRLIAYSLGNFATYARFNLKGSNGLAPLLEVQIDRTGKFLTGKIHSFLQIGEGGPQPDSLNQAALEIRRLTELDFPDGPLKIEPDGSLKFKGNRLDLDQ